VRCVNENRMKRKRLRWQAANHGCHCFDRVFLLAGACVCCVKFARNARNASDCVWMETGLYTHYTHIHNVCRHLYSYWSMRPIVIVVVSCYTDRPNSASSVCDRPIIIYQRCWMTWRDAVSRCDELTGPFIQSSTQTVAGSPIFCTWQLRLPAAITATDAATVLRTYRRNVRPNLLTINIRWKFLPYRTILPNTNTLFGPLFGPNRIRTDYSVQFGYYFLILIFNTLN